jgi:hypothetical protein
MTKPISANWLPIFISMPRGMVSLMISDYIITHSYQKIISLTQSPSGFPEIIGKGAARGQVSSKSFLMGKEVLEWFDGIENFIAFHDEYREEKEFLFEIE